MRRRGKPWATAPRSCGRSFPLPARWSAGCRGSWFTCLRCSTAPAACRAATTSPPTTWSSSLASPDGDDLVRRGRLLDGSRLDPTTRVVDELDRPLQEIVHQGQPRRLPAGPGDGRGE